MALSYLIVQEIGDGESEQEINAGLILDIDLMLKGFHQISHPWLRLRARGPGD